MALMPNFALDSSLLGDSEDVHICLSNSSLRMVSLTMSPLDTAVTLFSLPVQHIPDMHLWHSLNTDD